MSSAKSGGSSVGPLLTTQWDQWWPYNALCPEGAPTGCVATAMAQIMNYWQYPTKGIGYVKYSTPQCQYQGPYQISYNQTYYKWDSMDVQHPNAISTLMFHAGTSSGTHFNPGASSASLEGAMYGLQTYFDYSDSMSVYHKVAITPYQTVNIYSDSAWKQLIIDNLNDSMPVLYGGGISIGHAWVVDGYDANNLFHMNFGWSGYADGYYDLDEIYTDGYDFSDRPAIILNISPANSILRSDFRYEKNDEYNEMSYSFHDFSKGLHDDLLWNFGDGTSDTVCNPLHIYTDDSLYTVRLITNNGGGVRYCC